MNIYIINPEAGINDMSENIRYFLSRKKNYEYLVFDVQEDESEMDIIERMMNLFEDEMIRFYICGGSGTFTRALSSFDTEDLKRVEIAYFPCGTLNDMLKMFGDQGHFFYNMDNLIRGGHIYLDYVKNETDNRNDRSNFVQYSVFGYLSYVEFIASQLHFFANFNSHLTYMVAFHGALFFRYPVNYQITVDGTDYSGYYESIYIGNGVCFGEEFYPVKNASPNDGKMEVILIKRISGHTIYKFIDFLQGTDVMPEGLKGIRIMQAKSVKIRRKDKKMMSLNVDGNSIKRHEWNVKVVHEGFKFVVPNGVELVTDNNEDVESTGSEVSDDR